MAIWRLALSALLLLAVGVSTASAILPTERDGQIPPPAAMVAPEYRQLSGPEAASALPGWNAFVSKEGSGWFVALYRDDLRAPSALMGRGIDLLTATAADEQLAEAARAFASENAAVLNLDPTQLGAAEVISLVGEKRGVLIQQTYEGLEVIGGRAELYFDGGKLVMMGSEFFPGIDLSTAPALSAERAQVRATEGLTFNAAVDIFDAEPRLVVYPMILEGAVQAYLAWEVRFTTASPEGQWWTYVDASDGEVLTRVNHLAHYDIPTTVKSDVQINFPTDPETEILSADHWVQANSSNFYTNQSGFVNLSVPNNQSYAVHSEIRGRWVNVNRYDGTDAAWNGNGSPGVPLEIKWDDTNSILPERDAYYSVNRIHTWLKSVDPSFNSLDFAMNCYVNRTDGTCNAYWNGSNVNFYKEGGGCVNMATMSDVVMHEYGHGITQYTYSPSAPPTSSGMGEAFSDICAQTNTNDRYVGRGIYNGSGYIRDAENLRQYPATECGTSVHCLGEVLMGSCWKARKNFISTHGYQDGVRKFDLAHRAAWKTKQFSMPNYLTRLLMADDDNANLSDGTPNYHEICDAFALHNLPCPGITQYIFFLYTPVEDLEQVNTPISIQAYIEPQNCGSLLPDSTKVHYTVDGGQTWSSVLMAPAGPINEFVADIPGQPCGTLVEYYIRGVTSTGVRGTEPDRAPELYVHRFMVGPASVAVDDNFEADQGWTTPAPDDNATAGLWQRVDPIQKINGTTIYQPENDHTTGLNNVLCWVTDGTGGYYLNGDVDGGSTTILSPIIDMSTASVAKLDFWAFYMDALVTDDTLRASVSNDGGETWLDVKKIFGMNLNAWNNYITYFTEDDIDFTNQMRFRFRITDYNNNSCLEGLVDDVYLTFVGCSGTDDVAEQDLLPRDFTVQPSRPNPMRQSTSLRFALPAPAAVRVDVFDASGRLVRNIFEAAMPAGYHAIDWDGRDTDGRQVSSGVYWYRVNAGDEAQTRKLLVVR